MPPWGIQLEKPKMWENSLVFSTNKLQEKKRGRGEIYRIKDLTDTSMKMQCMDPETVEKI